MASFRIKTETHQGTLHYYPQGRGRWEMTVFTVLPWWKRIGWDNPPSVGYMDIKAPLNSASLREAINKLLNAGQFTAHEGDELGLAIALITNNLTDLVDPNRPAMEGISLRPEGEFLSSSKATSQ